LITLQLEITKPPTNVYGLQIGLMHKLWYWFNLKTH